MNPEVWGPGAWTFLHSITFQYPEKPTDIDKQKYYTFFNSLKNVLPCPVCRDHYNKNFEHRQRPAKMDRVITIMKRKLEKRRALKTDCTPLITSFPYHH